METITDEQYVKMVDGKLVLVKQKSCPVRTALHTVCRPLSGVGISVYDSLDEFARKRNSLQVVESPNFKECRQVNIAVEALLQRGPRAPEPPDDAVVEWLVFRGPDMGIGARVGGARAHGRLGLGGRDCGGGWFVGRG